MREIREMCFKNLYVKLQKYLHEMQMAKDQYGVHKVSFKQLFSCK